jgi:16S rRNA pseudouridine516 synthase
MKTERLDKILASQNIGSRREVGELIRAGRVTVGGETVLHPDYRVDAEQSTITLDGVPITVQKYLYLMMNKPAGVLSASRDPSARTVVDLLPKPWRRRGIFPAGRLDRDTEGLLILTDDGAFAHKMLAPKSHVTKWYEAHLKSPVTPEDAEAFRNGIVLSNMTCLPAELTVLKREYPAALVKVREGKFHQVKRMFLARGNEVLALRRVRIGGLTLDERLGPGQARELDGDEITAVFEDKIL